MFGVFHILQLLITIANFQILLAIQINSITVPLAVQNNTGVPITLDCNYTLRPSDKGFILKWFLNREKCVYHWQPPKKPIVYGPLKGRLDLGFRISEDPFMAYRALRIMNPTSELEGEYKCFVSTNSDEDSESKKMIVFEPEEKLAMTVGEPENGEVNFTCSAFGVYPEPKLTLYKNEDYNMDTEFSEILDIIEWTTIKHHDKKFDSTIVASTLMANLTPGDILDCELKIPNTGYVKKKSIVYYPPYFTRNGSTILSLLHVIVVVAVWGVLFI